MKDLIIRKGGPARHDRTVEIRAGVIEAEQSLDSTLKQTDTRYYDIDEMIQACHIELLVAELNRELIG